jgi:hypothetical protein
MSAENDIEFKQPSKNNNIPELRSHVLLKHFLTLVEKQYKMNQPY